MVPFGMVHNSPEFGTTYFLPSDSGAPSVDLFCWTLQVFTSKGTQCGESGMVPAWDFAKLLRKRSVSPGISMWNTHWKVLFWGKWTQQSQELKNLLWALPGLDRFWKQMSNLCFLVLLFSWTLNPNKVRRAAEIFSWHFWMAKIRLARWCSPWSTISGMVTMLCYCPKIHCCPAAPISWASICMRLWTALRIAKFLAKWCPWQIPRGNRMFWMP